MHKGTAVRREGDVARGASARVAGCHDAVVYLLAPVEYASVIGCTDCVVVVGAVARALRVEQCERLTLIAATRRLQVRNCHEGTFYLGAAEPPLFRRGQPKKRRRAVQHLLRTTRDAPPNRGALDAVRGVGSTGGDRHARFNTGGVDRCVGVAGVAGVAGVGGGGGASG